MLTLSLGMCGSHCFLRVILYTLACHVTVREGHKKLCRFNLSRFRVRGLDFGKMDSIKIRCQQAVLVQSELNYMSLAAAAAAAVK